MFALYHYRLFRIGELAKGDHPVKACNVHISHEKEKNLFILWTSKMHDKGSCPQKIKIESVGNNVLKQGHFCPFKLMKDYLLVCGDYASIHKQFFVYKDKSPVLVDAEHLRK